MSKNDTVFRKLQDLRFHHGLCSTPIYHSLSMDIISLYHFPSINPYCFDLLLIKVGSNDFGRNYLGKRNGLIINEIVARNRAVAIQSMDQLFINFFQIFSKHLITAEFKIFDDIIVIFLNLKNRFFYRFFVYCFGQ